MAGLLVIVALLLGLNLIVKTAPAAAGQAQVGPVPPVPVGLASGLSGQYDGILFRLWSDGSIDGIVYSDSDSLCGPNLPQVACTVPIVPGTCTADVTRNGQVEINDFLEVLGQWGPCE